MKLATLVVIVLQIFSSNAIAAPWSGVSLNIEDYSTDWNFQTLERTADIRHLNINMEEKTTTDLSIGVNIGQMSLRIYDKFTAANTQKFDLATLGLYLRWPLILSDHLFIQSRLSYQYNSGEDTNITDPSKLEWDEFEFLLGLGIRWQSVRITPFATYFNLDGDISNSSGTQLFESVEEVSPGIRFDYFVDPTAYVRLQIMGGSKEGAYLIFAREY